MSIQHLSLEFVAERLSAKQAPLAFPLMREAVFGLTLDCWLRYARRVAGLSFSAAEGVLVVRHIATPYLCGAVCYHRDYDVQLGKVLTAEHFVAMDLLHPRLVLDALCNGLDEIAISLGCENIRTLVKTPETMRVLCDAGHLASGEILLRGPKLALERGELSRLA